jgi:hypothetical protein
MIRSSSSIHAASSCVLLAPAGQHGDAASHDVEPRALLLDEPCASPGEGPALVSPAVGDGAPAAVPLLEQPARLLLRRVGLLHGRRPAGCRNLGPAERGGRKYRVRC